MQILDQSINVIWPIITREPSSANSQSFKDALVTYCSSRQTHNLICLNGRCKGCPNTSDETREILAGCLGQNQRHGMCFSKQTHRFTTRMGHAFEAPSSFQSTEAYLLPFGLHTVFRWYLELTYEAWAQRNALSECKAIPRTTPRCRRVIRMESVERHVLTFRTLGHYRLHLRKEALSPEATQLQGCVLAWSNSVISPIITREPSSANSQSFKDALVTYCSSRQTHNLICLNERYKGCPNTSDETREILAGCLGKNQRHGMCFSKQTHRFTTRMGHVFGLQAAFSLRKRIFYLLGCIPCSVDTWSSPMRHERKEMLYRNAKLYQEQPRAAAASSGWNLSKGMCSRSEH